MKTIAQFRKHSEQLVLDRFLSQEELENNLERFLGFEVSLEHANNDDEFYCDNFYIANLMIEDDYDLYLDIYYLKDRQGNIVITEVSIDFENSVYNEDKKIIGKCRG